LAPTTAPANLDANSLIIHVRISRNAGGTVLIQVIPKKK